MHQHRLLSGYFEVQGNGFITKLDEIKSCSPYKKKLCFPLLSFGFLATEGSWDEITSVQTQPNVWKPLWNVILYSRIMAYRHIDFCVQSMHNRWWTYNVIIFTLSVFTVFCIVCTVFFVLFRLCIFIIICFVCTGVRTTATKWQLNCS
jgi:hypothetical protein